MARAARLFCAAGEGFYDARNRAADPFVVPVTSAPLLQWQAMAKLAGATDRNDSWRCERVGRAGRRTRVSSTGRYHPWSDIWLDRSELRFPLKIRLQEARQSCEEHSRERSPRACSRFRRASGNSIPKPHQAHQAGCVVDGPPP